MKITPVSRRDFVRTVTLGATFLASGAMLGLTSARAGGQRGPSRGEISLDQDWRFGGKFVAGMEQPGFDDAKFAKITLPHCVAKLSYENWKVEQWQDIYLYRRHFQAPEGYQNGRVFLHFDRVMVTATPSINGHELPKHIGGYLPFHYDITEFLKVGDNVLSVIVDSRWQDVPPEGTPKGPPGMDYFAPGGIPGSVFLRVVPKLFISDVFAKPVNALQADRTVEITCTIDAAALPDSPAQLQVELLDGTKLIAKISQPLKLEKTGQHELKLTLDKLNEVKLWDVDAPQLYRVITTIIVDGQPFHDHQTRIGFREAKFAVEGFFLNGKKLRLFGLNRHELYPYVGLAMPDRVMRRDAEILKRELNCNIVRCSHYPQTEAFLDACDELGLMVWEETPGWGFVGDDAWQEIVVQNVNDMIVRDRNHAAIVIWGVRVNESRTVPALYERTTALAKKFDGTRATSGSMTSVPRKGAKTEWKEDVYAYDEYHSAADGTVAINAPMEGVPYMLAETIGQFSYGIGKKGFGNKYHRSGDIELQGLQAIYHAEAHDKAGRWPNFCGVIAWCGFEYASPMNDFNGIKCPGVADVFRIPKLGAAFYQAQVSPQVRPVIQLSFYWDFGPKSPRGPGKQAAIFSNCDRLELFVAGKKLATAGPDRKKFPHTKYPPFFCDLDLDGADKPELRIDGYVGDKLALSRSFSSDPSKDQFLLTADDSTIGNDGADATRLVLKVTDKFGEPRAFGGGTVSFEVNELGVLIGDNPIALEDSGGVGAVWLKSTVGEYGPITIKARHSTLGEKTVVVTVK